MTRMESQAYCLEKKTTCFNSLRWDFRFNNESSTISALLAGLANSSDWAESIDTLYPRLISYVDKDKHRVMLIPETGRIEIRIHYTTSLAQRCIAASKLAGSLSELQSSP